VQTLVENSVKHAIAPFPQGGAIRISAKASDERVFLEIWDSGPGFELEKITAGRGLDNLQSRLTTLFNGGGSIGCRRLPSGFLVTMSVPRNGHVAGKP
jgi:LytS/YehU family sensor histidine kinase